MDFKVGDKVEYLRKTCTVDEVMQKGGATFLTLHYSGPLVDPSATKEEKDATMGFSTKVVLTESNKDTVKLIKSN